MFKWSLLYEKIYKVLMKLRSCRLVAPYTIWTVLCWCFLYTGWMWTLLYFTDDLTLIFQRPILHLVTLTSHNNHWNPYHFFTIISFGKHLAVNYQHKKTSGNRFSTHKNKKLLITGREIFEKKKNRNGKIVCLPLYNSECIVTFIT